MGRGESGLRARARTHAHPSQKGARIIWLLLSFFLLATGQVREREREKEMERGMRVGKTVADLSLSLSLSLSENFIEHVRCY